MKKQLRVGFDLDGVLLYNPARIARPIIVFIKKIFFKKEVDKFHYPQTKFQKLFWLVFHKIVFGPAFGYDELKRLIKSKKIKAYIITGRNESLKNDFNKWLIKLESNKFFSGSYFNDKNEQPYIFKEKMIKKLRLDLYVEDNWDIVYFLKLKMKNEKLKMTRAMATDMALTVAVGSVSSRLQKLLKVTESALDYGIRKVRAGARIGDISSAIQKTIETAGFGVVRDLAGHGVGYKVHENPFVPNYGTPGTGAVLREGMVLAIEPMATSGDWHVVIDKDEWAFRTADGKHAAHFEHTIAVTSSGCVVLTK